MAAFKQPLPGWKVLFALVGLFHFCVLTAVQERLGLGTLRLLFLTTILLAFALVATSAKLEFHHIQTIAFGAFLGVAVFHVILARNNYAAYGAAKTLIPYLVIYLATITFSNSPGRVRTLAWIWVLAEVYVAFNTIGHPEGRGVGYSRDQNDTALALNMVLALIYFLGQETRSVARRVLLWSAFGVVIAALVATGSRGGFIGLLAVVLFLASVSKRRARAMAAVGLVMLAIFTFAPESYVERIETISNYQDVKTAEERFYLWKIAWWMFLDNPVVGVGGYNSAFRVLQYEPDPPLWGRSHGGQAIHSLYFTLLSEFGLIGTILFLMMIYSTFRDLWRVIRLSREYATRPRDPGASWAELQATASTAYYVGLGLIGGLVGFLATGAFLSVLYYPHFWTFMAVAVALRRTVEKTLAEASAECQPGDAVAHERPPRPGVRSYGGPREG